MKVTYTLVLCLILLLALFAGSCDKRDWVNPLDPANELPTLPALSFDPIEGSYATPQEVQISCNIPEAIIRYTTNGTVPSDTSSIYLDPIPVNASFRINARAFKAGYNPSPISSAGYVVNQMVMQPFFYPPGGTYSYARAVSIFCDTADATIRYSINGDEPTITSPVYSEPLMINTDTTVKAIAYKTGFNPSITATAEYTIMQTCATPLISPQGGSYSSAQSLSLSCATSGASIHYTLDAMEPTESSALYSNPVSISSNCTVKAKAFKDGYNASNTASAVYTFIPSSLPSPIANPDGGVFTVPQIVQLSCSVANTVIRYTTNGLEPNSSSPQYIEPIYVAANTVVKAKAYKSGYSPSAQMARHFFFKTYLQGWGRNSELQCDVPTTANIIALAAGYYHGLAIKEDKSLIGWGYNANGETHVPSGNSFVRVAAGYYHGVALRENGSLVAWGLNTEGQCNVPSGNNYVAISAGNNYCLALDSAGALHAWGSNGSGCLSVPTGVFTAISAGFNHCLAIRADGSLHAWGRNVELQCNVPAGNDFIAIAAGYQHSLALRQGGSLVAWGDNSTQQCDVPPGFNYISVGAGYGHSTAIKVDGTLSAWGRNDYQQCNVPPGQNYFYVSSGFFHNIAQRSLGK